MPGQSSQYGSVSRGHRDHPTSTMNVHSKLLAFAVEHFERLVIQCLEKLRHFVMLHKHGSRTAVQSSYIRVAAPADEMA